MARRADPKPGIAVGIGLPVAYVVWRGLSGLEQFRQLYSESPIQETVWMIAVLLIVGSFVSGCVYAVLRWIE